jgi:hypothetical protein
MERKKGNESARDGQSVVVKIPSFVQATIKCFYEKNSQNVTHEQNLRFFTVFQGFYLNKLITR